MKKMIDFLWNINYTELIVMDEKVTTYLTFLPKLIWDFEAFMRSLTLQYCFRKFKLSQHINFEQCRFHTRTWWTTNLACLLFSYRVLLKWFNSWYRFITNEISGTEWNEIRFSCCDNSSQWSSATTFIYVYVH